MKLLRVRSVFWILSSTALWCCLAAVSVGAGQASAADGGGQTTAESAARTRKAWKKRWIFSWLAVAAVHALDIHSSQGYRETNPLLRNRSGQFATGKALLLKSAISGGFFASQLLVMRRRPEGNYYKPFTIANTVGAAGLGAVAAHNYSLPPPKKPAASR